MPVRPWGVQVIASESGTSTESTTVFVGLPAGRTYENPEMLIVLSPTLERMLIELALGQDVCVFGGAADRVYRKLELDRDESGRRATRPPIAPPICWRRRRPCNICGRPARPPRPRPHG